MTSRREAEEARARERIAAAEREDAALASLPTGHPWRIFAQRSAVWATLEPIAERNYPAHVPAWDPTIDTVAALAPALPPVPLVLYRGRGCTSLQPAAESPPTGYAADDGMSICPCVIDAEGAGYGRRAQHIVRWWTRTTELIRISVAIPEPFDGSLGTVAQEYTDHRARGRRPGEVISARYSAPPGVSGGICGAPDAFGERDCLALPEVIGWWRTPDGPGRYTLYFVPFAGRDASLADLVRAIREGADG